MPEHSKPISSPVDPGKIHDLRVGSTRTQHDVEQMARAPYREAVGALQFVATRTRPDICVAVGLLSRWVAEPRTCHWEAAKRVLRYLRCTADLRMVMKAEGQVKLEVRTLRRRLRCRCRSKVDQWQCDSDWRISRRTWRSVKQSCVSLPTAEAEYVSLAEAVRETVWI
jgi:hypothetical protein